MPVKVRGFGTGNYASPCTLYSVHTMLDACWRHQLYVWHVAARRSAQPLDIVGLPGYERLTDAEKQVSW